MIQQHAISAAAPAHLSVARLMDDLTDRERQRLAQEIAAVRARRKRQEAARAPDLKPPVIDEPAPPRRNDRQATPGATPVLATSPARDAGTAPLQAPDPLAWLARAKAERRRARLQLAAAWVLTLLIATAVVFGTALVMFATPGRLA
jgi:hypothetical protein